MDKDLKKIEEFLKGNRARKRAEHFLVDGLLVYMRRGVMGFDIEMGSTPGADGGGWSVLKKVITEFEHDYPLRVEFVTDVQTIGHLMRRTAWKLYGDAHLDARRCPSFVTMKWGATGCK